MPTTTKGTWTPADNDDWDFTIDLAATANSIDLWTTGRYEKSSASVAGLGVGDYVGQFGFVSSGATGIPYTWSGSAWVPVGLRSSGTTTQMNNFTTAPDGFEWFNTTDGTEYTRIGGVWVGAWTIVMAAGPTGSVRAQWRKNGGYVEMRGIGTKSPGTYGIFTLPSGARPFQTLNFQDATTPVGSPQGIQILSSGQVNHTNVNEAWVSLDLVRFGV